VYCSNGYDKDIMELKLCHTIRGGGITAIEATPATAKIVQLTYAVMDRLRRNTGLPTEPGNWSVEGDPIMKTYVIKRSIEACTLKLLWSHNKTRRMSLWT
jgi:hypothetical protein